MEEFKELRKKMLHKIVKQFNDIIRRNEQSKYDFSIKDLRKIMQYVNPTRPPLSYMSYPRDVTYIRAFMYASVVDYENQNFSI